jgi:hypothetical protein
VSDFEKKLQDRIDQAQGRILQLSTALEGLQKELFAAQAEVTVWQEALATERRKHGENTSEPSIGAVRPFTRQSLGDAVLQLLRDNRGEPMHAKDILRELRRRDYPIASKNPIAAIVTTLTRRRQFKRVRPNTFGLVEETELIPDS